MSTKARKRLLIDFCEREFQRQVQWLIKRFDLVDYDPRLTYTFRFLSPHQGGMDSEGVPFVRLSLKEIIPRVGDTLDLAFEEYAHINDDPAIGKKTVNWKSYIACVIAHELAHTLTIEEFPGYRDMVTRNGPLNWDQASDYKDDHGLMWQTVYRIIREEYVDIQFYPVRRVYNSANLVRKVEKYGDTEYITFVHKGRKQVAWYIREGGIIYLSDKQFKVKRGTSFKSLFEVRKHLTN